MALEYTPSFAEYLALDMKFDHHVVTFKQREAASRAIIRCNQHKSGTGDWDSALGTLHPLFLRLDVSDVTRANERVSFLKKTWEDLCDAVSPTFPSLKLYLSGS